MNSYITHAYKGILFCLAMVMGTHCTTGVYCTTPYASPIKNDADPSAQQTIGDEFKAIWKTEIKKSDEEIIPHIRSIVHECFKKEAKQWYSVTMEFIMDKNEFFISQYNQHHEMIKGIFLKLPITSLQCLVAQLGNAKDKAIYIKNFNHGTSDQSSVQRSRTGIRRAVLGRI
ncbi:hypothetical protein [Cardinium endosymbiont of Sogatella furcifera]|uniref:hypothetical protein n=1 Tax=Cardinium endosymbiont of Sogatella furcifera TaxID=650378 RepID=UPI0013B426C9|nr:hypothetical protein [Cardinium endosymbiont of Sogatella furcifera]